MISGWGIWNVKSKAWVITAHNREPTWTMRGYMDWFRGRFLRGPNYETREMFPISTNNDSKET